MIAAEWWIYQSTLSGDRLKIKASRLLPGPWIGGFKFLDDKGDKLQVAVHVSNYSIRIINLNFNKPNAPPIEGDPAELLEEWQRKLGLKLNEKTGEIEPMYPNEVPKKRENDRIR